jgi:hypothetical protein
VRAYDDARGHRCRVPDRNMYLRSGHAVYLHVRSSVTHDVAVLARYVAILCAWVSTSAFPCLAPVLSGCTETGFLAKIWVST